eukprot:1150862-Pelagomonas_calceolata.AAC.6
MAEEQLQERLQQSHKASKDAAAQSDFYAAAAADAVTYHIEQELARRQEQHAAAQQKLKEHIKALCEDFKMSPAAKSMCESHATETAPSVNLCDQRRVIALQLLEAVNAACYTASCHSVQQNALLRLKATGLVLRSSFGAKEHQKPKTPILLVILSVQGQSQASSSAAPSGQRCTKPKVPPDMPVYAACTAPSSHLVGHPLCAGQVTGVVHCSASRTEVRVQVAFITGRPACFVASAEVPAVSQRRCFQAPGYRIAWLCAGRLAFNSGRIDSMLVQYLVEWMARQVWVVLILQSCMTGTPPGGSCGNIGERIQPHAHEARALFTVSDKGSRRFCPCDYKKGAKGHGHERGTATCIRTGKE